MKLAGHNRMATLPLGSANNVPDADLKTLVAWILALK